MHCRLVVSSFPSPLAPLFRLSPDPFTHFCHSNCPFLSDTGNQANAAEVMINLEAERHKRERWAVRIPYFFRPS